MNTLPSLDIVNPLPDLVIGNKRVLPIVQGGMGVGVSTWKLAGAVAREGGVGTLSSVGHSFTPEYKHLLKERLGAATHKLSIPERNQIFYDVNLECIRTEVRRAREVSENNGMLWMNVMMATNDYAHQVLAACEAGIDGIVSGAGLPLNLPEITKEYPNVSLIPILSNAKGVGTIIKRWGRFDRLPDAIVLEDPSRAGGHLGSRSTKTVDDPSTTLEVSVPETVAFLKANNLNIPVIAAGGIVDRADIDRMMGLGASGVQMGTRFLATHESGAGAEFKQEIIKARIEDIIVYVSNAMLPARALRSSGIFDVIEGRKVRKGDKVGVCTENCLAGCAYRDGIETLSNTGEYPAQMCILRALAGSIEGSTEKDANKALYFTGTSAARINTLKSVNELMGELKGNK